MDLNCLYSSDGLLLCNLIEKFEIINNDVSIVCATDKGQFIGLIALINSIIKNTNNLNRIHFYILVDQFEKSELNSLLDTYFKGKVKYHIKEFEPNTFLEKNIRVIHDNKGTHKVMNFARFYFPNYFQKLDKILYMDCDMIVQDDIVKLYDSIKLDEFYFAAVTISKIGDFNDFKPILFKRGIDKKNDYFNAGLFVTSLKRWEETNTTEKLLEIMVEHKKSKEGLYKFGTQSALNYVFHNNYENIYRNWNVTVDKNMSNNYINNEIKVIHYTGSKKPWLKCGETQCGLAINVWNKYNLMKLSDNNLIENFSNNRTIVTEEIPPFPDNAFITEVIKDKISHNDLNYLANYWITDKGDKHGQKHNYMKNYQLFFDPFKNKNINIMEIGIARGSSLKTWSSFFRNASIDGIDINKNCKKLCKNYDNINIIIDDAKFYKTEKKYDIIIDDGSHLSGDIIETFNNLINNLNKNGLYVIEDMDSCKEKKYIMGFVNRDNEIDINEFVKLNNRDRLNKFLNELENNKNYKIELREDKICFIRKL
jgi:lipopolysaccharide biosynthesis glycosyltransferase